MRFAVIEDEGNARERLISQVIQILPDIELIGEAETIEEGKVLVQKLKPDDVLFSDVQLADGICFEIFKQIAPPCPVIFTTAYERYAIDSFEVNTVDYLLKPIKSSELKKSLDKISHRQTPQTAIDYKQLARALMEEQQRSSKRFLIKVGNRFVTLAANEIAALYTENRTTMAMNFGGKAFPMDEPLEKLLESLEGTKFFRINRQVIVNRESITGLFQYSKGRVKITLSVDLPLKLDLVVSTERSTVFKKWLEQ